MNVRSRNLTEELYMEKDSPKLLEEGSAQSSYQWDQNYS